MPRAVVSSAVVSRLTERPVALVLAGVVAIAVATTGWIVLRPGSEPDRNAAAPTTSASPTVEAAGREYGLRFRATATGTVTALSFHRESGDTADHPARLWTDDGELLAEVVLPGREEEGWQSAALTSPVPVNGSELYVASVSSQAPPGDVAPPVGASGGGPTAGFRSVSGAQGPVGAFPGTELRAETVPVRPVVLTPATTPGPSGAPSDATSSASSGPTASPSDAEPRNGTSPSRRPRAAGGFPGPGNTGVPAGVELSSYRGPMTIQRDGTTLDARRVEGTLTVAARNVVIERSSIRGVVVVLETGSLTISDSTVEAGTHRGSALGQYNLTMRRVEVRGAAASVSCNGNCDIRDSWLHDQYIEPGSDWHGDGFISNGGDNMLLRHNTLACDSEETGAGGACSAALAAYGDFAPITNLTVDDNLFVSSPAGYCLYGGYETQKPYGPQARNVVITDNVFQRGASGKCAVFGPAANVAPRGNANGNVFTGNRWDDGKPLRAD